MKDHGMIEKVLDAFFMSKAYPKLVLYNLDLFPRFKIHTVKDTWVRGLFERKLFFFF
jgi:hypothetical protein